MKRTRSVIVERLGEANAARLSALVGGTRLYVPGMVENGARLRRILGDDLAVLVILHFGDSRFYVPTASPNAPVDLRRVKRLVARGWSSARIARELGCSERTVDAKRAVLRKREKDR